MMAMMRGSDRPEEARIRIINATHGEGPLEIREAWIGIELEGTAYRVNEGRPPIGVLTGKPAIRNLTGAVKVDFAEAVTALERAGRTCAADWYRNNAIRYLGASLIFVSECFVKVAGSRY